MLQPERQFITVQHLLWLSLAAFCLLAGAASLFVNSLFIIAAVFLIVNVVLILKYPIWGLLSYLIIFLMRPAEMYPVLAPLRIELLTGLLAVLSVVLHQKLRDRRVTFPTDRITVLLLGFLAVMCISMFVSYEKTQTVETITAFVKLLIFYYLIVSTIDTRKKFVAFVTVFLLLIAHDAYDALRLYLAGAFIHTMGVDRLRGGTSAAGDPNSFAATLASTIPFVVASAYYFRNVLAKVSLSLLALGLAILITITASRGGLVAFGGVVLGGIAFSRHKFVAILAVVLLLIAGWTVLPDQYRERYKTISDVEHIDKTSSGRWQIWASGVNMIISQPILGVGAGTFRWANNSGDFGRPQFMQAHNLYIQLMATTGVVGFAVWFGFAFSFVAKLRELMRKVEDYREHQWIRVFSISFAVSLIALFISGLFAHSLYRYTWYMMAGLTVALANLSNQLPSENNIVAVHEQKLELTPR